jgi:soluble lytic murein transglycosylase-like protein
VRLVCACLVLGGAALAQSAPPAAAKPSFLERQQASVERQKEALTRPGGAVERQLTSVRRQAAKAVSIAAPGAAPPSTPDAGQSQETWFTLPWPTPLALPRAVSSLCLPSGREPLQPVLSRAARDNHLPESLLAAVIARESGFDPCAVSSAGALGLMQLMPETASFLNVDNPFDPEQNVQAGSRFLRSLLDRYGGDLLLALSAYNAGPARVDRAGGVPPIRETQEYVQAILGALP